MEPVYASVIGFAKGLFAAQGLRFTILGAENVPRTGGAVLVVNHTGYFDFAYAGLAAQPSGRLVRFMAKDGVFAHPVGGPLMRGMKHIPVDRGAGAGSYSAALDALRAGEVVGIFPEATISRSFELKEFKTGAARLAAEAEVPIVPLVIWGSQRVWSKGLPRRLGRTNVPIIMTAGEPVPVAADADPEQVTAEYKAVMAGLLDLARGAYEPMTGSNLRYLPARLGGTAPTLAEATRLDAAEAEQRRVQRSSEDSGS
ncbi:MAG: lysophospholipid acyltransferase family protein [Terracoccus sp.]